MIKLSGIFTLSMGILMIAVWIVFLALGMFPEIKAVPLEAAFLLAAESLTAIALVTGGFSILRKKRWGKKLNLTAMGMMLYTAVYSIGVFGQDGMIPLVVFFIILTLVTVFFLIKLICDDQPAMVRRCVGSKLSRFHYKFLFIFLYKYLYKFGITIHTFTHHEQ